MEHRVQSGYARRPCLVKVDGNRRQALNDAVGLSRFRSMNAIQ